MDVFHLGVHRRGSGCAIHFCGENQIEVVEVGKLGHVTLLPGLSLTSMFV